MIPLRDHHTPAEDTRLDHDKTSLSRSHWRLNFDVNNAAPEMQRLLHTAQEFIDTFENGDPGAILDLPDLIPTYTALKQAVQHAERVMPMPEQRGRS